MLATAYRNKNVDLFLNNLIVLVCNFCFSNSPYNGANIFLGLIEYELNSLQYINSYSIRPRKIFANYHSFSGPNVCLARLQMELCRAANILKSKVSILGFR